MPWGCIDYVCVDLDTIEVTGVSCHNEMSITVCGRVVSKDGRFDRRVCTKIYNSPSLKAALKDSYKRIADRVCGDADNPEMCEEYYEDMIGERACEELTCEDVEERLGFEEVAEALAYAAMDHAKRPLL